MRMTQPKHAPYVAISSKHEERKVRPNADGASVSERDDHRLCHVNQYPACSA